MKLIVGLGNIGEAYAKTRHNAGFLLLNYLVSRINGSPVTFKFEMKFEAKVLRLSDSSSFLGSDLLFVKPQTFMNDSGRAVRKIVDFYRLSTTDDLLLLHDDLDIEFGRFKIMRKGPRVHNGVSSIENALETEDFWRVRLGIAGESYDLIKKQGGTMKEDYVLKDFSPDELIRMDAVFSEIWDKLGRVNG